ncbi:hypothetical protein LEMLEM_LOCUS17418 [Lemmus lemmus]
MQALYELAASSAHEDRCAGDKGQTKVRRQLRK